VLLWECPCCPHDMIVHCSGTVLTPHIAIICWPGCHFPYTMSLWTAGSCPSSSSLCVYMALGLELRTFTLSRFTSPLL
jgi:hypothetical protein